MNIRHIESSRSSSYNDSHDNQISLSKSINDEDSKERITEGDGMNDHTTKIKTLEISRSKYEGKALKTKRNSTKMSKTKDKD
jgi:hypothetical protein